MVRKKYILVNITAFSNNYCQKMNNKNRQKNQYDYISVSHFFPPNIGGLENMAYGLLKGLSNKGIRGIAIFGSNKRYLEKGSEFDRISFNPIKIFDNTYPIFGLYFLNEIFSILKKNPDSKVVIHSRHLTSSLLTSLACSLLKHPYTVIEHNAGQVFLNSTFITRIANALDKYIFRYVLDGAENIFAVSVTGKEWISKTFSIPKERIDVIYNGYDTPSNSDKIAEKKNIVVFASKWINVKDPQTTLKAYELLAKKYPKWEFRIYGEGKNLEYDELEKYPPNLMIINKLLNQEELFELLKKSKIYINSSLSEGLALGILEAISFGNIPVLSDAKSNIEIANQLTTSDFIFPRGNYKSLAGLVEKAIAKSNNQKYVDKIVSLNKKYFSKEKMIEQYYQSLLPKHFIVHKEKLLLSIIIPVYNEEASIIKLLKKVSSFYLPKQVQKEIIIVNDKSTDNSLKLVEEYVRQQKDNKHDNKYIILSNKKNLGKSRAVKNGVLHSSGDFVVTQDADLEYKPSELGLFVRKFLENPNIDVIYGNRFNKNNKFSNIVHSGGNQFLTFVSNLFTRPKGFAPKDMETCYKMVRGDIMRKLFKASEANTNFGLEPELTAKLARYRHPNGKRLNFDQIDIYYKPRTLSQGKKMLWFKHGGEALLEIIYFNISPFIIEEFINGKRVRRQL